MLKKNINFFISAIFFIFILNSSIFSDKFHPLLILIWIASIILFLLPFVRSDFPDLKSVRISKKALFVIPILILPSAVRILSMLSVRKLWIHQDDMIASYFSAKYDLVRSNFFGPIPFDRVEWVSQFPAVYHFIQKAFFLVFGESLFTVKLSTIPYIFITSLFLYLTVKLLFNRKTALIALVLYTFFSVSLYHETLGLHINGSTATLMVFFYLYILYFKYKKKIFAALTGVACAFCFFFYPSSYIAFPLMFIFFFLDFLVQRKRQVIVNWFLATFSFLLVASPFLTNMYQAKNFYITHRSNQVNLFTGELSDFKERVKKGESGIQVIKKNFISSARSMFIDGIGGSGGYDFGHLAFFEKGSLLLFLLGAFVCLFLFRKKLEFLMVFVVIISTFLIGVVLTNMPPNFQRLLVAAPFIIIIISAPFFLFEVFFEKRYLIWLILVLSSLAIYSMNNYLYFLRSIEAEKDREELKIGYFIQDKYPDRKIYVAAFRTYALKKIFYFYDQENMKNAISDYHDLLLPSVNPNEKYVYVLTYPEDFNEKFKEKDKNGKIIDFSSDFSLFVN